MNLMERFTCGFYILSALSVISGVNVEVQKPEYEVARDDRVDLVCTFQTTAPKPYEAIITWSGDADDPADPQIPVATYFSFTKSTNIHEDYVGKVELKNDVPGGVSTLSFLKVTLKENRVFHCSVQVPGDNEGEPFDTTTLVVLVAPTVPVCAIQGAAEYGRNINLTCHSEEGSPKPTYKWARFDPNNNPQPLPPKTIENNGVLSLFNVSMETSGYYVCTSTNKIRSASYNLTLSVMPRSMNMGATAGIIGGCAAALVILLIIIYCCCCRNKNEKEEHEMEEAAAFKADERANGEMSDVDRYRDDNEEDPKRYPQDNRSDYDDRSRYDERYEGTRSRSNERPDRYEDGRSRSRDRLDRDEDYRGPPSDRLERYDDNRGRSSERLDRYDDGRSRSSDRLDRYDDNRSRSSDRLDRYDDTRDRYDSRQGHYDDRRDNYSDRR